MVQFCKAEENLANRLLLSLPHASLKRLWPHLELHAAAKGDVITRVDKPIDYLHFVNRGLISFVKTMQDGRSVEIGVVGVEGVSSPNVLFGINKAIFDALVQISGATFRIRRDKLRDMIEQDAALYEALENYTHFWVAALAQTAACNRLHHIDERCCRWLLIAHDSARSDTFPLTQELLATILGVQRAGISISAIALQKAGLIHYRHGHVTITNRAGLEDAACECYRVMRGDYDKFFRAQRKAS